MNDTNRKLRMKLLTALATTGLVTSACGGSVQSDGTGGSAGSATGGTSSGGFGAGGTGGVGAVAGTGATGGAAGSAGAGGSIGIGGFAGAGGFAGDGPFTKGPVDCNGCGSEWTTCWKAEAVPVTPGTPETPSGCPDGYSIPPDSFDPCGPYGFGIYYYQPLMVDGYCCYQSGVMCPGGRPFMVDGELRVSEVCERQDWVSALAPRLEKLNADAREALTWVWLGDAQLEHAAVAAFARLTLQLMALGAPASLVEASQAASLDEVRHAKDCFALASRYAGRTLGPAPLALEGVDLAITLEALVRSTFEEGCVGETLAAIQAAEARRVTQDASVGTMLEAIEREESEHAALAFRVVAWALSLAPELRSVVEGELAAAERREAEVTLPAMPKGMDAATWHAHGRLTPDELRALRRRAFDEVVRPCTRAMLADQTPRVQRESAPGVPARA
ncbi:MAG: ferritin-like domain-containing protein [Polyangiaceae bacterium]